MSTQCGSTTGLGRDLHGRVHTLAALACTYGVRWWAVCAARTGTCSLNTHSPVSTACPTPNPASWFGCFTRNVRPPPPPQGLLPRVAPCDVPLAPPHAPAGGGQPRLEHAQRSRWVGRAAWPALFGQDASLLEHTGHRSARACCLPYPMHAPPAAEVAATCPFRQQPYGAAHAPLWSSATLVEWEGFVTCCVHCGVCCRQAGVRRGEPAARVRRRGGWRRRRAACRATWQLAQQLRRRAAAVRQDADVGAAGAGLQDGAGARKGTCPIIHSCMHHILFTLYTMLCTGTRLRR